jgi:hypothetical protein
MHGSQEGRFFHGYYDCYCYLPLYIFCGRHLLAAKLRRASVDAADGAVEEVARIVGQIRRRWPEVRILLRADSGFARDELMAWCEANAVHFVFGLAKNDRLIAAIKDELAAAEKTSRRTGKPAATEDPSPARYELIPKGGQCSRVCRHCMVHEVAGNDLLQPFPLLRD